MTAAAMPVKSGTTLLLIDVQNDFHPGGSLAVPTANDDSKRIADLIRNSIKDPTNPLINRIVVTLDSHHKLHIANPTFWVSGDDEVTRPEPFTFISSSDIELGKWMPRKNLKLPVGEMMVDPTTFVTDSSLYDADGKLKLLQYCIEYTRQLEENGKFQLCIWPEHCLIGSRGHCIVDNIREAAEEWCVATGGSVEFVNKGQNLLTEMYSAMCAEVPVSSATSFNSSLLASLIQSDRILVAGQALSHFVNYTMRDIVEKCSAEE